ncbi:MAG: hypothetical protein QG609_565 [Patescibacteria group bacterium]|nr:hypothetical protein [Patescibacteria group bacterium]
MAQKNLKYINKKTLLLSLILVISIFGFYRFIDDEYLKEDLIIEDFSEDYTDFSDLGQIKISGVYKVDAKAPYSGDIMSFRIDEKFVNMAPWGNSPRKVKWFLFSNDEEAKNMLNIALDDDCAAGEALITIDNYKDYIGEVHGPNWARLVSLEYQKPSTTPTCSSF